MEKIPEFTEDLNIISRLSDSPNTGDMLDAQELKAKFDKAGLSIQKFMNQILIPAINNFKPEGNSGAEIEILIFGVSDAFRIYDAIMSGRPVYCLYENQYYLPLISWNEETETAVFSNSFVQCKAVAGEWSGNPVTEDSIEPEVFVGTSRTTVTEFYEAFSSRKPCFLMKPFSGYGLTMWVLYSCSSSVAYFYRITPDGSVQYGSLDSSGTFSYETAANSGSGESNVFIGDADTTVAEFVEAFRNGKSCFLMITHGGGYPEMWTMSTTTSTEAYFYRITGEIVEYGTLNSDGTFESTSADLKTLPFVGDSNTTVAEFYEAFQERRPCFAYLPMAGGINLWTVTHAGNQVRFIGMNTIGTLYELILNQDGSKEYIAHDIPDVVNQIDQNSTDNQIPTAKAVYDSVKGKLDATALPAAVNDALTQAKESGEFNGAQGPQGEKGADGAKGDKGDTGATGQRGTGLLSVTTAPSSYTTAVGGITPKYRMALSTIKTQAGVTEVLLGDTVRYSYYHYPIDYLDASYAYFTERVSIRGATGAAGADGKDYSFDPTVYGLPVLYLTGDTSPIAVSKDNKVTLSYVYGDRSGSCTLKGQGATSYKTAQALVNAGKAGKFNYTIKFDNAFEAKTGWGAQQKYCLKANFIDTTHSRNIVSCILWGMSVKARSTVPTELADLPNGGAIDGFPIIIMLNGEFHGLYTWNIPKDGWMFGMVEDTTKTQAIVGADDHTTATQFKEASMSGFETEFVSDEDNAAWVETSLTRLISAIMNSNGYDLDTTVAQYLDWDSAIDHYIHTVVDKAPDCVDKNYLLATFDGVKWYMSEYDRDSIHGLNWDASGTTRPVSSVSFAECAETVRVYELIYRFKTNALKARYKELRGNILSESRIMQKFENFAWAIPSPVMLEDVKLYPTIQGSGVNTIDQIGRFVRQRLETVDAWVDALPAQETPVEPEEPVEMVNQVPISIDTDGSIYNGTGYKDNTRLSSSGGVSSSAQSDTVTIGFVPFSRETGIVRMKGATFPKISGKHFYINLYKSDKTYVTGISASEWSDYGNTNYPNLNISYDEVTGITTFDFTACTGTSDWEKMVASAAYFRLCAYGNGADLVVTVNQEITD